MKALIFVVSAILMFPSFAASAQDTPGIAPDVCHFLGNWASQVATARANGIPMSKMMDVVYNEDSQKKVTPDQSKDFLIFRATLERIVFEVYRLKLSANDAYITYRASCAVAGK